MKSLIIAATLAGLAVASPLTAQGRGNSGRIPPGQMPRAGMCRVWIDGVPPGRQPGQTDCATARAQAAANGGRVIYGSSSRNREDCTYSQSTNSVGDIIFGRSGVNTTNFVGINPLDALFWTSVINGFLAPPLLVIILVIANKKSIMGSHVNPRWLNVLGWTATLVMTAAAVALGLSAVGH